MTGFSLPYYGEVELPTRKVKAGFEGGDEKKARKVVFGFFKQFEKLDESLIEELEGILKKFVPLFRTDKK